MHTEANHKVSLDLLFKKALKCSSDGIPTAIQNLFFIDGDFELR